MPAKAVGLTEPGIEVDGARQSRTRARERVVGRRAGELDEAAQGQGLAHVRLRECRIGLRGLSEELERALVAGGRALALEEAGLHVTLARAGIGGPLLRQPCPLVA